MLGWSKLGFLHQVVAKLFVDCSCHLISGDPERHEEPEEKVDDLDCKTMEFAPKKIVDDLNPTEDGESSEETHCPPDQTKLGLRCHLHKTITQVLFILIEAEGACYAYTITKL